MKATEIIFNKNLEMYVPLKDLGNEVYITLSDSLFASEEELVLNIKKRLPHLSITCQNGIVWLVVRL